jgi:3-oxoacyl-[acyl-carrier protein] reductase
VNVVITARGEQALLASAEHLRSMGPGQVRTVVGDVTTALGRELESFPIQV